MYWRLFVFYAESGPIDTKPCVTCATAVWSICIGIHQTYLYITILTTLSKMADHKDNQSSTSAWLHNRNACLYRSVEKV